MLLHGKELLDVGDGFLADLLAGHDNSDWTYDVTTMLRDMLSTARSLSAVTDRFNAHRDLHFDCVMQRLPPLLEAAPDRVMWGTDFDVTQPPDDTVLGRYVSSSQDVLDVIPAKHRESSASQNAVALFEN